MTFEEFTDNDVFNFFVQMDQTIYDIAQSIATKRHAPVASESGYEYEDLRKANCIVVKRVIADIKSGKLPRRLLPEMRGYVLGLGADFEDLAKEFDG